MKDGISKTGDKEKENQYGNMVIHMKVNGNKMIDMAMVFFNLKVVKDTLEISNKTNLMVMVFVSRQMVLCIKVNGNMANKQEQKLVINQMVVLIRTFGLKVECCTK